MSLNHILKDIVPDNEKLNVKFGTVQADNLDIPVGTFENLVVDNLGVDIGAIIESLLVRTGFTLRCALVSDSLIRTSETVEAKAHLFKSQPFLNSTTIGPSHTLFPPLLVNGMAIFDDPAKGDFDYKMPYKADLDIYFGLTGAQEYAFRFNVAIFANIPTNNILRLIADDNANSGVSFNYAGTRSKILTHSVGTEHNYSFVGVRQTDGNYIIYG